MRNQLGFTLVELLVAISIVIAMSSMVLALSYPWLLSFKLSGAARSLAVDLRYVQQKAVAEQIEYGVYFGADFYQLKRFSSTSTTVLLSKPLPRDVRFSQINGFNANEVIFNVYGAAETAGNIVLTNSRNENKALDIRPSGFVKAY
ncbi:MAG: prepilin-type N-terminal cleavage/methylation domain-containing protein [Candidatus Gribaldobacteria bacterium]|nr:prepilin-type N-terminal cleavage/methylation domain-containing protein [Candidatus Gribaldobacteria bacterium]